MTSQRAPRRLHAHHDQHEQAGLDEATDPVLVDRRRWREGGWSNETGMAAFMSVLRLQQDLVAAAHETLRKHGLSITEHAALIHLAFAPGNRETLGRIAERLLIGAGRCNYVIKDLEAKGLVRRRPHPSDGRVTLAILSAKGRKVVAACSEAQARNNFGFGDLDQAELDNLVEVLTKARWASTRWQSG